MRNGNALLLRGLERTLQRIAGTDEIGHFSDVSEKDLVLLVTVNEAGGFASVEIHVRNDDAD